MKKRLLDLLPRFVAVAALIVWGLTLLQLGGPSNLPAIIGIGLASLLTLVAQAQKNGVSGLMLWLSGGIWSGAAYVSTEVIGLAYILMALLTLGSAALRERQRAKFSLSGPTAFIAAMVIVIVAYGVLSG
jgi:hypothetical protein